MNKTITKIIAKYNSVPAPVKAAFWFTLCSFTLKGLSFFSSIIYARIMPQSEYGAITVFNSYEQIILIVATWEIQLGAYTKGIFKYKNNLPEFTVSMQCLTNTLTIAVFVVILLGYKLFYSFTGIDYCLVALLFIMVMFRPAYDAWLARQRVEYQYKPAVIATLGLSALSILVPVISVLLFQRTAYTKNISMLVTTAVFYFFFWVKHSGYFQLLKQRDTVKQYWRFMIRFEGPLVLHSLSYMALNQADRIMIGKMVGNSEAGLYSVAYNIAIVITILQGSIEQALGPWRYHKLEGKNYQEIRSITTIVLYGYAAVVCGFILIAPEIIRLFYQESYYQGIWCIPPIAASAFFMFLYSVFVGVETYFEKTNYVLYVSVACGIINIILNYFGILYYGYIACAYTTLISYVSFAIGHFFFMKRTLLISSIHAEVYSVKSIVLCGLIVISFSIVLTALYQYIFIRYALLLIGIAVAFANKKRIVFTIKAIKGGE